MALLRIIAFKFLQAVPVILIISILAFLLLSLLPGDPAIIIAGEQASPEAVERVRQQLGLDRPFLQQLAIWLLNLAQGNFGSSLILNQSVLSAVGERLPVTLSLAALSISVTIPVGVFLGSVAAYYRQSWIDAGVMTFALLGVSIPAFWIAILGIILFSVRLGWVPSSGFTPISQGVGPWLSSVILPALILSLFQIGFLARMTRSAMLDVLGQDFIRTARAKGLSEWRTVSKHALRNALILIITATGILIEHGDRRLGCHRTGVRAAGHRPHGGAGDPGPRLPAGAGNHADLRLHLRADQPDRRCALHARRSPGAP